MAWPPSVAASAYGRNHGVVIIMRLLTNTMQRFRRMLFPRLTKTMACGKCNCDI